MRSATFNIWPAFTDALSGLVMVLIFLITVFVITEVLDRPRDDG
jgi:chemotaxis protein MotB